MNYSKKQANEGSSTAAVPPLQQQVPYIQPKYDNIFHERGNDKIYNGLQCTRGQLLSLLIAFYLRHKLTKIALQDLLTLINVAVPNAVPDTKYFLERYFFKGSSLVEEHYYCPKCGNYFGLYDKEQIYFTCTLCATKSKQKECFSKGKYFLVHPIKDQLKYFLENTNLASIIDNRKRANTNFSNAKGEVYSGDCYNKERTQLFLKQSRYNITMSFSSDGLQPFSSAQSSIWPLSCTINEVDASEKSNFIVMCCLYHDESKPKANTILQPFVDQTKELFKNGFYWVDAKGEKHNSRVMFCLCIADAPARAMFGNLKQFNGEYGCGLCLHPGVQLLKGGRGQKRVYDFTYPLPKERDAESTFEQAKEAIERGKAVMGVKGPSLMYSIPHMDPILGMAPDIMHGGFLGLNKQFMILWGTDSKRAFYVTKFAMLVDAILLDIQTPTDIPRGYRSYQKHGCKWKANEHKSFLLLYSPIALKDVLEPDYYRHWLLLVNAFSLILRTKVTNQHIETAALLLNRFVFETESLYGLEHMSYNVHLLTHLPDYVRKWGAPWAYSAFLYEDFCGLLKHLFHGSRYISKQIFEHFLASGKLREFASRYVQSNDVNDSVCNLYKRLGGKFPVEADCRSSIRISQLMGISEELGLSDECHKAITSTLGFALPNGCFTFFFYPRLKYGKIVYDTNTYCDSLQRNNSIVQIINGKVIKINYIVDISRKCTTQNHELESDLQPITCRLPKSIVFAKGTVIIVGKVIPLLPVPPCEEPFANNFNLTAFINQIDRSTSEDDEWEVIAFFPSDIKYKCLIIGNLNKTEKYVMVNKIKFESS